MNVVYKTQLVARNNTNWPDSISTTRYTMSI